MTRQTDEHTATSNEAALRFKLRADGIADLADHAALRRFAAAHPAAFRKAILDFAGIAEDTEGTAVPALVAMLLEADLRPDDRLAGAA
jgi:hypothetical protein